MTGNQPNIEALIKELKSELIQTINDSFIPVRYMNAKQAALYSGIGQKQLINLAMSGKIKGRQQGGRSAWRFDKESIDRYWHKPFEKTKSDAKRFLEKIERKA